MKNILSTCFLLLAPCYFFSACDYPPPSREKATKEANEWAKTLGITPLGVSCADYDTDNDGYVSCTISYKEAEKLQVMGVECARASLDTSACRLPKMKVPSAGGQ